MANTNLKEKELNLDSNYALEVISWYIWGKDHKPSDITDEKLMNKNETITLKVDIDKFIKKYYTFGDTVELKSYFKRVNMFNLFFEMKGKDGHKLDFSQCNVNANGEIVLNQQEFADIFYGGSTNVANGIKLKVDNSFYYLDPNKVGDFAQAAFVFGSTSFSVGNYKSDIQIDTSKLRYILKVDEKGNIIPDRIDGVEFSVNVGDFNFTSSDGFAGKLNPTLEKLIDPNKLGKTVKFDFINQGTSSYTQTISLSKDDFIQETSILGDTFAILKRIIPAVNLATLTYEVASKLEQYMQSAMQYFAYYKNIFDSDIINYSADGKYVIYGSNTDGDTLSGTTTNSGFDLTTKVDSKEFISMVVGDYVKLVIGTLQLASPIASFVANYIEEEAFKVFGYSETNLNPHKSRLDNGILYLGGDGNDTITGTDKDDIFKGGSGNDKYYAGNGDTIEDDDKGEGSVYFNSNSPLTGGTYDKDKACYVGGIYEYHLNGNTLIVTDTAKNESITINNYSKKDKSLGIDLIEADEIDIIISNATVTEGDESEPNKDGKAPYNTSIGIKLSRELKEDEFIIIQKYNYEKQSTELVLFGTLPQDYDTSLFKSLLSDNKTIDFSWYGNKTKEEDRKYCVGGVNIFAKSDNLIIRDIKPGTVTMKDDDRDPDDDLPETYDPLVIDLNNDGVKGTNLDYKINFDLDNNGFKEATSWIDNNDAFITIDKNNNGAIDNGSELFGNKSISNNAYAYTNPNAKNGFEALSEFDSNNDGIIDEKDKEFTNLLLWQDKNSNGISETDELIKLSDKVKSINLNLLIA